MRVQRIVDLSVPVGPQTVTYPGDPRPSLTVHSTIERDGFNLLDVHLGSQSGTHVDAPYHFEEDGARIDELDLGLFAGPGVVVDATGLGPRGVVTWEHLAPAVEDIRPGTIVLLRTGWDRHYGAPAYFENPYLDAGACGRLLDLGVRTIGLDAINLDETPDEDHPGVGFPCHHLIAAVGGVIIENLRGLDGIDFADPFISCLPIRLEAADGAPVRAVAVELVP